MTVIIDGTSGITSPGGDTASVSLATPIVQSPSSLTLKTNGTTTAMTIDTSQNVLVGTTSSTGTGQLQVVRNANDGSTRILLSNNNSGSGAASYYLFGNDGAAGGFGGLRAFSSTNTSLGGAGSVEMFNNTASLAFSTAGVNRMFMPYTGGVQAVTTISVGNATPSSSGAGITFPATQSASSDANTLDDYEEGTWTPGFGGTGSNPTVSYAGQVGTYVKVGKWVFCWVDVLVSSTSGGSGNLRLTGLPFSVANGGMSVQYAQAFSTAKPTGALGGSTIMNLTFSDSATSQSYMPVSYLTSTSYLLCQLAYISST